MPIQELIQVARNLYAETQTAHWDVFPPGNGLVRVMSASTGPLFSDNRPIQEIPESTLIERARANDKDAFGELVRRYQNAIFNLCYRMLGDYHEAEDAAQEVFIKVYRNLDGYRDSYRFSTWILSIASHHCIDRLRKRRATWVSLDQFPLGPSYQDAPQPDEVVLQEEEERQLQRLLIQLPEEYRLILILHYWYDLSYQEIARMLETTPGAVKTKAHRARRRLGHLLKTEEYSQP